MQQEHPYHEKHRPQFHFTAREKWLNDPNGLVYYDGEYHLFFQHQTGLDWGPSRWGHATSSDLVHWKQINHAIEPYDVGWIWSGSAVVDYQNTAGFKTGTEEVIVAVYTAGDTTVQSNKPCTQNISYSNDRGRTWKHFDGNPVLSHIVAENRDPKVIWYAPESKWVMALFLSGNEYALFSSPDLKTWKGLSTVHVPEGRECPDLFVLPVNGDAADLKWVFWAANGNYLVGTFDGTEFHPETAVLRADHGKSFYAAQTWFGLPEHPRRCIQIAWMGGGEYPEMPFDQQMSFPCELVLRHTPAGLRMLRNPVKEIETLRGKHHAWHGEEITHTRNLLEGVQADLLEIRAEIDPGDVREVIFSVKGEPVRYERSGGNLSCAGRSACIPPGKSTVKFHLLVDRTSIEVFADDGAVSLSSCFLPQEGAQYRLATYGLPWPRGRRAKIVSMDVYELNSIYSAPD